MAPGRCRPDPSDAAAAPPLAMKTEGSHHASSSRSVFAPSRIAVCSTSPVSPALAIDHLASLGWSPLYLGVVPEPAGGQQDSPARLDIKPCAVADDARTDHSAVFDDEVVHRGI